MKRVKIHTDGACEGNPGPGGWAAVLEYGAVRKEISGAVPATTNNRMEMEAALQALTCLKQPCEVDLFTDSEYLRQGITQWIHSWKARGWKKAIRNKDLWQRLDQVASTHKVHWHWVRGHAGHPENERCDVLATTAAGKLRASLPPSELARALKAFRDEHLAPLPALSLL